MDAEIGVEIDKEMVLLQLYVWEGYITMEIFGMSAVLGFDAKLLFALIAVKNGLKITYQFIHAIENTCYILNESLQLHSQER